jgi:hypothetical protein
MLRYAGPSAQGLQKRDGSKAVEARLMPLLVRFRAIWGGLAGTGARSSISCRCESLVAAIRQC